MDLESLLYKDLILEMEDWGEDHIKHFYDNDGDGHMDYSRSELTDLGKKRLASFAANFCVAHYIETENR